MLTIHTSDIFEHDDNPIAHGCNCFNAMGKGIAVAMKRKYPELYNSDMATVKGSRDKLGTFTSYDYRNGIDGNIHFNLYSQFTYWDTSDMFCSESYEKGLTAIAEYLISEGFDTLKIPAIGLGLAKGSVEDIVKSTIEVSKKINIEWYIMDRAILNKINNQLSKIDYKKG